MNLLFIGTNFIRKDSIYEYLKFCTNKYNLSKHIEFNTSFKSAIFNEEKGIWETIVEKNGSQYTLEASIIISAVCQLNRPSIPRISGIENFKNPIIHTAAWDHDYNFKDKNIALIGQVQVRCRLYNYKIAKKLTIFKELPMGYR